MELILSAGALGFFAILVQSMLLLGHSFTKSQQNLFESFSTARMLKQNICILNSSFNNINIASERSYSREEKLCTDGTVASCAQIPNPNPPPATIPDRVHSRKYIQLDTIDPKALIRIDIAGLTIEPSLLTRARAGNNIQEDAGSNPVFYKVFQDSHTLARLNINMASGGGVNNLLSGYIFASRCVENDSGSVHNNKATFNPDSNKKAQSAIQILEESRRPFYFPSSEQGQNEVIKCCQGLDSNKEPTNCESALDKWLPRIYVIHILPSTSTATPTPVPTPVTPVTPATSPPDEGLLATVAHIQEFPELQDINTFWGIGFVLSMDNKTIFSQSAFQLDTLIIKNTCSTSTSNIQNCPEMTVGDDPKVKKLIGVKKTMDHFLTANISSCSGYSSGVDTTGLIKF
ncbi:MAG: hypothetical protein OXM55_02260 [Bdellovibrionales bacterium]|nr:hypothetical protein [Bdellovibrionales bacterium]